MEKIILIISTTILCGCAYNVNQDNNINNVSSCIGTTSLPLEYFNNFKKINDLSLLDESLGGKDQGKLCQGQTYEVTNKLYIYRAWNSTNPYSKNGHWWSFSAPDGLVSDYRSNYEICYQWSPLDMMTKCQVKTGTKLVVGNGQSVKCSEYLTYPVSEMQQIYLSQYATEHNLENCHNYKLLFNWHKLPE